MKKGIFFAAFYLAVCILFQSAGEAAGVSDRVIMRLGDTYAVGSKRAPVTLVEFTDYQCPYCSKFHKKTFPKLIKDFVETGKVRFVSRDLPLDFHKYAFQAARATRCAGDQGRYWQMRHLLSSNPRKLRRSSLLNYAGKLQLNQPKFAACLKSMRHDTDIKKDITDANLAGIDGTPGFVIGHSPKPNSQFIRGKVISGAQP